MVKTKQDKEEKQDWKDFQSSGASLDIIWKDELRYVMIFHVKSYVMSHKCQGLLIMHLRKCVEWIQTSTEAHGKAELHEMRNGRIVSYSPS